ncbi:hypothetical protein CLOM_g2198 [Closterium sp. NIES-68]|nr:hypothetical protein CLOM_g2198 [Closterium sp. NIES-68]GJP68817.1 hypothetical protein CLOP_g25471 [Closterium sp. NIES-67]
MLPGAAGGGGGAGGRGGGGGGGKDGGGKRKMFAKSKRSFHHWVSPLLRFLQLFATVCALAVMLTAKVAGISYSSFHAFRYLIAASVIAGFWALLLLLIDLGLLAAGRTSHSAILKILRIIGDFIAAALLLSAGAAAAGVTTFNDQGGFPYQQTICEGNTPWNFFCGRSKAATAMSHIGFFFCLPSIILDIGSLAIEYYEAI